MKYRFEKNYYKTMDTFTVNALERRSYFIPFSSKKKAQQSDYLKERETSDLVTLLSGEWDFRYYPKRSLLPKEIESDAIEFETITVPSTWQRTGYENPCYLNSRYQFKMNPPRIPADIPVGLYRKKFSARKGESKILTFLGAASGVEVYLNGKFLAYAEESHNTNEFLLRDLQEENELVVLVSKFCVGSYLECQDMFRENGIFRDVYLTAQKGNDLFDVEAATRYEGESGCYSLTVKAKLTGEQANVRFVLEDAENNVVLSQDLIRGAGEFTNLKVKEWTAETPYVYSAYFIVLGEDEKELSCARQLIGFKHAEIKGEIFYLNGAPLKLVGVNHHDANAEKGWVMSAEEYLADARLMKNYHCNCVRMSHYPPDPVFLSICDKIGLYVIDEADIECHGVYSNPLSQRFKRISHRLMWKERFLSRVSAMYLRDRNHASIVMWSLGNEAGGYNCQDACYAYLKKRSPLPVHYEGVIHTERFCYDVISEMYAHTPKVEAVAAGKLEKYKGKPYFLCEYAHAMGVGPGELARYVELFYANENILGGCIWEFCDHAVLHKQGKYRYTYGGDHGEKKHDGNFCVDGLFFPDRTPSTGALEMRECYAPIKCGYKDAKAIVQNRYRFLPSSVINTTWSLYEKGKLIASGTLAHNVPPMQRQEIELQLPKTEGDDVYLQFRHSFASGGEYAGVNEIILKEPNLALSEKAQAVTLSFNKRKATLSSDSFILRAAKNGAIEAEAKESGAAISLKFAPEIYRAVIDNDRFIRIAWKLLGFESAKPRITSFQADREGNTIVYRYAFRRLFALAKCKLKLSLREEGILFDVGFRRGAGSIFYSDLTRLGVTFTADQSMGKARYFGRGERENLPDFKEHAPLGIYAQETCQMSEKYIKPQEGGTRIEVRESEFTGGGKGFAIQAVDRPYALSVSQYSTANLMNAAHREDLIDENALFIHADGAVRGAGSQSCGQAPLDYARVNLKRPFHYRFLLRPLREENAEK